MKGRNETHIIILVGFSYEKVNRVISFIQSQKYDKKWATANLNLAALVNPKQTYGFYTLKGPEWNLLALSILLNHNDYEAIMNEYETEFLKNNYTVEKIRERITNYDVVKESMLL